MKVTLLSALLLSTLAGACKSPEKSQKSGEQAAESQEDISNGSEESADISMGDDELETDDSVKAIMGADLSRALVADAGMSQADADELVKAGHSSVSLVSGSIASDAAAFLSGVLSAISSKTVKVPDLSVTLKVIGNSVTTSIVALAGPRNEFALGGVPDLAKPEVLEALKAMFGNGLSRLPGADKVAYVHSLLQGLMKAIGSSEQKLSSAQFTGMAGSLSSGIIATAGAGLNMADLSSFTGETARGIMGGSIQVKDFPLANIGDLSKAVSDGAMKGAANLPSFDFANIGGIAKSVSGGLMQGAGSIPNIDTKSLEAIAKSSVAGLLGGVKMIPNFDTKHLPLIGSGSLNGLLEEAGKIPGYDKNNLSALAKTAAASLMAAAANLGLDPAAILALAKSSVEGSALAIKNLNLLSSLDFITKFIASLKEGLKEGAGMIPGFDLSQLDSLATSIVDIFASISK